MYKIFLFVVVLGTTLADDDFDDRFDDSREIHYVRGRLTPTLKGVGVPLPFDFFKSVPVTKTDAGVSPVVKTASDVEVVHVDQQVDPTLQPTPEVTDPKFETPAVNFRTPFIVKVDDDDDDDDDDRVYFRRAGASAVPLTYSAGPYGFKFDFDDDDDDDDDDDHRVFFRNINPKFRNAFRVGEDVDRNFFRSVGVPLPPVVKYDDNKKVLLKSGVNTAPKYIVKVDDDDYRRFFFRTTFGNASPIPYSGRFKFDDDLFDFDDDK